MVLCGVLLINTPLFYIIILMKFRKKLKDPSLEAQVLNIKTYNNFFDRLSRIALSMFEWENLPLSMNSNFLEWSLFNTGQAALLYDDKFGYINTKANIKGNLNIYNQPVRIECYSYSYNSTRNVYQGFGNPNPEDKNEAIFVQNMINPLPALPTVATLELFAMRLYETQRSEDVNIKLQKFPYIITGDKRREMTLKTIYENINGNTPVIFPDKEINLDDINCLNTNAPYVADKLQLYRRKIWQEALEFLGVNCIVEEKKERLVNAEADANNEVVNLNLQAFLVPRQRACRYFNEKFGFIGTNKEISVKVRSDLYNVIKQNESVVNELMSNPGGDNE